MRARRPRWPPTDLAPRALRQRRAALGARLRAALAALVVLQARRPLAVLAVALLTVVISAIATSRLTLRTSLAELLPQDKRSVVVAERIGGRLSAASVLLVVAEGEGKEGLERFVDALAPELRKLPPDLVGHVDAGVRSTRAFFEGRALLYAPIEDVREVHDAVLARYEYEVGRVTGAQLDLDGEDAPPPITPEMLRTRVEQRAAEARAASEARFPDGYYLEPGGKLVVMVVHTAVPSGDIARSRDLRARVEAAIAAVDPARFDPAIRVHLAGDFIESLEENEQVKSDLGHVGLTGVLLILGVVFCFYLRMRALAAMALTVGIGVVWTFGLAQVLVGHLNASTGFLVSIVAGNGINFGIIYMARYLEARRTAGVVESLRVAHAETWSATLAAAGAAMVAYGSLVASECRAFRQFGLIGGTGMVLCWIATYVFLPAILVMSEKLLPVREDAPGAGERGLRAVAARLRGAYGRPFALVALRFPRAIAIGSVAVTALAIALGVRWVAADPMEYDLGQIRTRREQGTSQQIEQRAAAVVGRGACDGVALVADGVEQARALEAALEAKRDAAPPDAKPFGDVVTVFDLLPRDQEAKIALLEEVRDRLERARRRGLVAKEAWDAIAPHLAPAAIAPIGAADLPEAVARPFTERDGTRGRVAYVTPAPGRTLGDARYLMEWADSLRETRLADGTVVEGSGRSVIFADLIRTVLEDAPRTILLSLGATALILVVAFRGRRAAWVALVTLLAGLAWMVGFLALYGARIVPGAGGLPHVELAGMKLNFLNFVALPISIGVGADYAVNMVERHRIARAGARAAPPEEIRRVVVETGGAVVLCSLTTTLGYVALMLSQNQAIRSFGIAAAVGEIGCVLAAVLVLPAWLVWLGAGRPRALRAGSQPHTIHRIEA